MPVAERATRSLSLGKRLPGEIERSARLESFQSAAEAPETGIGDPTAAVLRFPAADDDRPLPRATRRSTEEVARAGFSSHSRNLRSLNFYII